jgi:predicted AlkP superfamily phosphohydrolase/phosphomutase
MVALIMDDLAIARTPVEEWTSQINSRIRINQEQREGRMTKEKNEWTKKLEEEIKTSIRVLDPNARRTRGQMQQRDKNASPRVVGRRTVLASKAGQKSSLTKRI